MYWKQILNVPPGIRYISQWSDFSLQRFQGHNIIHKQLPGCGMTEYILTCPFPAVLGSPRRILMQNKKDQHGDDVFLVKSKFDRMLDIDDDITKNQAVSLIKSQTKEEEEKRTSEFKKEFKKEESNFYSTLFKEIDEYLHKMYQENKPPKIIVTYDSAYLVKKVLESMGILDKFWFIVDEFQSLMEDARFKADTELSFLTSVLPTIPNVTYVSATPLLDKYIKRIPELNNIPYYELDWGALDKSRIKRPDLKVRTMKSVSGKIKEVVKSYLDGNFEKIIASRCGRLFEIESRECVIYVNSVNHIINTIKSITQEVVIDGVKKMIPMITPDMVNILCSDTPDNQKKVEKKLGRSYKIGKVPLRGEPHKMFTFCTRTVYLGADFYSTNARSFIFSDSNSDCLSVDISMDLAQILGRQRLEENPWHNSAEFYYKVTADYKKMTWEDFKKILSEKDLESKKILSGWEKGNEEERQAIAKKLLFSAKGERYKGDYVGVNRLEDNTLIPVYNNLVYLNEERSFDIQQIDYANRFSVFCSVESQFRGSIGFDNDMVANFFYNYDQITTYLEKCKMICEFLIEYPKMFDPIVNNLSDHDKIRQQLISVGPERMKGLGYNLSKINKAMGITIFDRRTLDSVIYLSFKIGERYSKKYIKEKLTEIYLKADFHGTAKANHLENWFNIRECKITIDGKREMGFEILSVK